MIVFVFKRDLFLGDEDKMMETIADLDKCGSLEEAKSYVKKIILTGKTTMRR